MILPPVRLAPIVVLLVLAGCSKTPDLADISAPVIAGDRVTFPANAPQRSTLAVAAAEPHAREVHHVTGRLTWDEEATVRIYTPVAGRVMAVNAAVGDRLAAGAALARLNSPDFGQAQADALKAAADLLLAERTLTRTKDLFEHGAAPHKDLEGAENALAAAQSEQQRALARLTQYGATAEGPVDGLFTLRTPLAGVVVEKNINPGQEVRSDLQLANAPQLFQPQFVISEPRRLWVLLDVTEMEINLLQPGQVLRIRTRAFPGRTFEGRFESIGPALDPVTRTVRARGSVDNSALLLKAEMYVDVEIDAPEKDDATVAIANTAVFTKEGKHYAFVETAPGSFQRREITPGSESGGRILVRQGVKANERVLIEGSLLVEALLESGGKS